MAHASSRCSQLSITSRRRLPARKSVSVTSDQSDERSCAPRATKMACGTSSGSWTGASGANQTPSGKPRATSAAALTANLGLADPATARQRQQARGRQQPLDFMQLVAPPDEAGRLDGSFGVRALAAAVFTEDHPTPRSCPCRRAGRTRARCSGTGRGRLVHRSDELQADAGEQREQALWPGTKVEHR